MKRLHSLILDASAGIKELSKNKKPTGKKIKAIDQKIKGMSDKQRMAA